MLLFYIPPNLLFATSADFCFNGALMGLSFMAWIGLRLVNLQNADLILLIPPIKNASAVLKTTTKFMPTCND